MYVKILELSMNNKFLTVLICNYKHDKYLPQCLQSVYNQTIPDCEIIVVHDDPIKRKYGARNKVYYKNGVSIFEVFNDRQKGQATIINEWKKAITTPYICFLDTDDFFTINRIQLIKQQVPFDFSWTNATYWNEKENIFTEQIAGGFNKERFIKGNYICSGSYVYRTEVIRNTDYPINLVRGYDYIFNAKLFSMNLNYKYLPETTYIHRVNTSSAKSTLSTMPIFRQLYRSYLQYKVRKILNG
jgi:glycosyltransferase involved in cell wall biosynthesis